MKKAVFFFVFLILVSGNCISQDLRKLSSLTQVDSLKTSNSGNVILFNFWASWCQPCVEEIPGLLKLKNEYSEKGFKIIFISLDFPEEVDTKLKPFLKKNNMDFTTYLSDFNNPDEIMNYFDKKWDGAIPATFIYDREGQLKSKTIGSHDYEYFKEEISGLIE